MQDREPDRYLPSSVGCYNGVLRGEEVGLEGHRGNVFASFGFSLEGQPLFFFLFAACARTFSIHDFRSLLVGLLRL
jgi:hypothetical protein